MWWWWASKTLLKTTLVVRDTLASRSRAIYISCTLQIHTQPPSAHRKFTRVTRKRDRSDGITHCHPHGNVWRAQVACTQAPPSSNAGAATAVTITSLSLQYPALTLTDRLTRIKHGARQTMDRN